MSIVCPSRFCDPQIPWQCLERRLASRSKVRVSGLTANIIEAKATEANFFVIFLCNILPRYVYQLLSAAARDHPVFQLVDERASGRALYRKVSVNDANCSRRCCSMRFTSNSMLLDVSFNKIRLAQRHVGLFYQQPPEQGTPTKQVYQLSRRVHCQISNINFVDLMRNLRTRVMPQSAPSICAAARRKRVRTRRVRGVPTWIRFLDRGLGFLTRLEIRNFLSPTGLPSAKMQS